MSLTLSRKVDHAILTLVALADRTDGRSFRSATEISTSRKLSYGFTQQVLLLLKGAGFVHADRGQFGGYTLAKTPEQISLRDIVRAVEGDMPIMMCQAKDQGGKSLCPESGRCSAEHGFAAFRTDLSKLLEQYVLTDFMTEKERAAYAHYEQPIEVTA